MKAYIIDKADPSVGILEQEYWADVPIDETDDVDSREYLREGLRKLYSEYSQGTIRILFDDELPKPQIKPVKRL